MRRVPIVLAALLLGFLGALAVLGSALLAEAVSGTSLPADLALLAVAAWLGDGVSQLAIGQGLTALWLGALALCLMPVAASALIGEAARHRGWLWYAAASGLATAAGPALLRAVLHRPVTEDGRLILPLFLAGVAAGSVYWFVAGRSAGQRGLR